MEESYENMYEQVSKELERYQDMTQDLLELCLDRLEKETPISPNEILDLVKEWEC